MKESWPLGANMVIVCYLLLKEANIHVNLICFDQILDYQCSHLCPQKTVRKATIFSTKTQSFVEKTFDMCLLLGLSSSFSKNSHTLLKACHLIIVPLYRLGSDSVINFGRN